MPRIMIVEDDMFDLLELEELLIERGYEVAGKAESGSEAVAVARDLKPDLILMDIKLAGKMDGIKAAEKIKSKMAVPIVFLTGHSEAEILERAGRVNPQGFILKPYNGPQIRAAIEIALKVNESGKVGAKGNVMAKSVMADDAFSTVLFQHIPGLTAAEFKIARLVRNGLRTKEIAESLKLSKHTVNWHRNNIRRRLGLDGRGSSLMGALRALME